MIVIDNFSPFSFMKFKIMSEIIWGGEIILRDQKNRYTNLFPFMLSWRFSKAALGFWHKFQLSFPSCFPHLKWCPKAPNWRRQPAAAVISPALLWAAEWKISFYLPSLDQISTKSIWIFFCFQQCSLTLKIVAFLYKKESKIAQIEHCVQAPHHRPMIAAAIKASTNNLTYPPMHCEQNQIQKWQLSYKLILPDLFTCW